MQQAAVVRGWDSSGEGPNTPSWACVCSSGRELKRLLREQTESECCHQANKSFQFVTLEKPKPSVELTRCHVTSRHGTAVTSSAPVYSNACNPSIRRETSERRLDVRRARSDEHDRGPPNSSPTQDTGLLQRRALALARLAGPLVPPSYTAPLSLSHPSAA